jgi:hypothetical protein
LWHSSRCARSVLGDLASLRPVEVLLPHSCRVKVARPTDLEQLVSEVRPTVVGDLQ